ncbi:MAG: type I-G CRISPR-associated protein Csb2, partial [Pirellulales bacterium]
MSSHLCITARFIQKVFHGRADGDGPEWPPSPLRLFQALVAAAAARCNQRIHIEDAVPALRWLEQTPCGLIVAPVARPAETGYRIFFPDNVGDLIGAAWVRGANADIAEYRDKKDVRPTNLEGDAVHYLFPITPSDAEFTAHSDLISMVARSITHLGWGIDMIVADASVLTDEGVGALRGEYWLPTENHTSVRLRVPISGTLDDLMRKHAQFLDRIAIDNQGRKFIPKAVAPLTVYRVVGYRRATDPLPRPYAAFAFYRPDENTMRSFPAARSVAVAGMVRCLAGKMARQTGHHASDTEAQMWVNEYVMGHAETDVLRTRFSYLPLPTIRPPNVAGNIRRVVVAEEPGGVGDHAAWATRTLRGQILISEQPKKEEAMLMALTSRDAVLRRYIDISEVWDTVTPLVLPGCDGGKAGKTEKLFAKALQHAGYSPESLAGYELRGVSFWPGGGLAQRYKRPEYLQNWG